MGKLNLNPPAFSRCIDDLTRWRIMPIVEIGLMMRQIFPQLYIGNDSDYLYNLRLPGWKVVQACKDPFHRDALGYTGRSAPVDHPEYLMARRENRLILNLVDAEDPAYIHEECIDGALAFIRAGLREGYPVLVHCNQGRSRAPSIGLLYLASRTDTLPTGTLADAEYAFKQLYPDYAPGEGMRGFLLQNWYLYT